MYRALTLYTLTLWACIAIVPLYTLDSAYTDQCIPWRYTVQCIQCTLYVHTVQCIHCTHCTVYTLYTLYTLASVHTLSCVYVGTVPMSSEPMGTAPMGTCPIVAAPTAGGVTLTLSFLRGAPFINSGTSAYKPRYQCIAPGAVHKLRYSALSPGTVSISQCRCNAQRAFAI